VCMCACVCREIEGEQTSFDDHAAKEVTAS
jgi:hypothetical protein